MPPKVSMSYPQNLNVLPYLAEVILQMELKSEH